PLAAVLLPQRHARPPERLEREGARRPCAADLRRRRALGDPAAEGDSRDLVAADQALLVAALAEVRDPGLPPAGLLLRVRAVLARVRARPRHLPDRDQGGGVRGDRGCRGAGRATALVRAALHAVRHVV